MIGNKYLLKISMLAFTLLIFFSNTVFAEPNVSLSIDSLEIEENTSTNLTLSIENYTNAKIIGFYGMDKFKVLSKNSFNSTFINNGVSTQKKGFNYVITGTESGTFQLQGVIEENGKQYKTNILSIKVTPEQVKSKENASNLFVETNLSKDAIYMGEKIILSYDFYSRYSIESFGFKESLDLDNFISKNISNDKHSYKYTNINGEKYIQYDASTSILSPIKEGSFTIPSFNFQANIVTNNFFNSSKPEYLQTDSKNIEVKSLPLENKPKDFSGLVGSLNLQSSYSKTNVDLGDSLTLKVSASGDSNIENLTEILKGDIPGFTVYQTDKNFIESTTNKKYSTKKDFEIILVPKESGTFDIKPVYINYFDPASKTYKKAIIQGTTIEVINKDSISKTDSENNINNSTNNINNNVTKISINKVDYDSPNKNYFTIKINKNYLLISTLAVIVLILLILGFILFRKYVKVKDKQLQHICSKLKNTTDENDLYNILNEMIKYRYNLSIKSISKSEIINRLPNKKILDPVLEIVEYIEHKKYSQNSKSKDIKMIIEEIFKSL